MLFNWLNPTIAKGFETRLEPTDVLALPQRYEPRRLFAKFRRAWLERPSVRFAIWRAVGCDFLQGMGLVLVSVVCDLAGPFVVNRLIDFLDSDGPNDTHALLDGLIWVGILALTQLTNAIVRAHSMYWVKLVGISIRSIIMKAIFDKTTRLGPSARASESSGKLVNQMAADSQRFLFLMPPIQNLLCVPLYLGYVVTYLYILLGAFALTGLLVMLVSMIVSSFLARSLRRMQAQKSAAAGEWLPRQRPSLPLPLLHCI